MDKTRLSIDSLGESEVERLRDSLKQKEAIVAEKSEIIKSLRQQVADLKDELEETEKGQQVLYQKLDRLAKEITEKNEHLEAVTHSLEQVETAHDNLNKKYEARVGQVKELFDDLKKTKKDLEKAQSQNEELKHNNERLTVELEVANARKRVWMEEEQERLQRLKTPEPTVKQAQADYNGLKHYNNSHRQLTRQQPTHARLPNVDNRRDNVSTLHFQMADEVGEIMDSSSALPLTPSTANRAHQQSAPIQEPSALMATKSRVLSEIQNNSTDDVTTHFQQQVKSVGDNKIGATDNGNGIYDQNLPNYSNHIPGSVSGRNSNNVVAHYCPKHQPKNVAEPEVLNPIEEYKMRVARANELARRNKLTKPLHQTSYALELDTFDTTDITENEIKCGNIAKAAAAAMVKAQQMAPALSTRSQRQHQMNGRDQTDWHQQSSCIQQRRALADRVNTTPVARRVYKKAEAFIV